MFYYSQEVFSINLKISKDLQKLDGYAEKVLIRWKSE